MLGWKLRRVIKKEQQEHVLLASKQNSAVTVESHVHDASKRAFAASLLVINARALSPLSVRQAISFQSTDRPRPSSITKLS
jgi:hypothetical protein